MGAQVVCACLRADGSGHLCGSVQVSVPTGHVTFAVSPGQALAVALRLGVTLVGDEQLLHEPSDAPATSRDDANGNGNGTDTIARFLESLDLSGLGS